MERKQTNHHKDILLKYLDGLKKIQKYEFKEYSMVSQIQFDCERELLWSGKDVKVRVDIINKYIDLITGLDRLSDYKKGDK